MNKHDFESIDRKALLSKTSESVLSEFLLELKPLLIKKTKKYCGFTHWHNFDDMFAETMRSFCEAVESYDAEKGSFITFADMIIASRLKDKLRQKYREKDKYSHINTNESIDLQSDSRESPLFTVAAVSKYQKEESENNLALEMEMLTAELSDFKITLDILVKKSPKHQATKQKYKEYAKKLLDNQELCGVIKEKKYYPVKKISQYLGIQDSEAEYIRVYLISIVIIKHGDYDFISDYIKI